MNIAIFGYGHFGRAIGSLLEENGLAFTPVDIDMPLTREVDVILQVVPTQHIRDAFQTNARFIRPDTIIVNCSKGIERTTHELPYQIIRELGPYEHYFSLIGPSFASGMIDKDPTLVSLGYKSNQQLDTVKKLLQTSYFRIQPTTDYQTLELAGALKNVYAILCGYADGLGFGMNTRAKLITLAMQEVVTLAKVMHGSNLDVLTPGILGDMVLTCSSPQSRNYQFGTHLGTKTQAAALKAVESTVEGYHTSQSIQALARQHKVKLPVATLTQQLIEGGVDSQHHFHAFVEKL
jgi:glycerol-3-phosphate dehydrogenase (NAD(P)+)